MRKLLYLAFIVAIVCIVASCGYRNPNVYSGPSKKIYFTRWKNRTSELGLDSKIYRSLTSWFQKSSSIITVLQKDGADLIVAGEVVSIDLPSLSYGANNVTTEVKVKLKIRYIVKEIATNKIILEKPSEIWTEAYSVTTNATTNRDNEEEALETIIDELSQKIYQTTIAELPKL